MKSKNLVFYTKILKTYLSNILLCSKLSVTFAFFIIIYKIDIKTSKIKKKHYDLIILFFY